MRRITAVELHLEVYRGLTITRIAETALGSDPRDVGGEPHGESDVGKREMAVAITTPAHRGVGEGNRRPWRLSGGARISASAALAFAGNRISPLLEKMNRTVGIYVTLIGDPAREHITSTASRGVPSRQTRSGVVSNRVRYRLIRRRALSRRAGRTRTERI